MRVAVFRAAEDGRRTATRLEALGHQAVLAPVLRIVPTGATVRAGDADGLVFTSAHAVAAVANHPDGVTALRHLPCWCVGAHTAAAARAAGFSEVTTGPGTAADLAAAIVATHGTARLAFLAGRDRKPDLERALLRAGVRITVIEVYQAQAVPEWPADIAAALRGVEAALHFSRRTAELACRLVDQAGLTAPFAAWTHCCLSADVATGLRSAGIPAALVANKPDEADLLALISGERAR